MIYKAAVGHNIAEVSLITLDPQPACPGIMPIQRQHAVNGAVVDDGEYTEFVYSAVENETQYVQDVLTPLGLNTAKYANVTVLIRNDQWQSIRKNAIAIRPEIKRGATWARYFPRDIVISLKDLETPT